MNEAMIGKIKALLAKAESTPFPEEQAAFSAKAQELISRYAVDQALLGDVKADVVHRQVRVFGAYPASQVLLWVTLATENGCFALRHGYRSFRTVELCGAPEDLEMVMLLHASVWRQCSTAADHASSVWREECVVAPSRGKVRAWRSSFQRGYVAGVRDALRAANQTVGSSSVAAGLVLVDRLSRAEALASEMFDWTVTPSRAVLDEEALFAGHAAGKAASFATASVEGGRLQLGR